MKSSSAIAEGRPHVDTLAQQVLTEATLLALEGLGEGLERPAATARDGATTATVVEEGVNRLLEHALLVVDDDSGGVQVEQALEAVVAVDDTTVEVVEVRCCEAAAVELHHGAQIGRDDRDDVQDHVSGVVAALQEGVDDLEALDRALLLLLLGVVGRDDGTEAVCLIAQVDAAKELADGLGAHATLEVDGVVALHLGEERLIGDELALLELHELVEGVLTELLLLRVLLLEVGDAHADLVGREDLVVAELAGGVGIALRLEALDLVVALGVELLEVGGQFLLEVVRVGLAGLSVDGGDDVAREVQDLLEVLALHVEQARQGEGRRALEVPDVRDGRGQLDVAHALAAHLGARDLDAAALADDALEADALVLAAGALPVLDGTEDLLAEKTVLLGLEGAVVDGLGLLDLAVRPAANLICGGERDLYRVEISGIEICHVRYSLSSELSPIRASEPFSESEATPPIRSSALSAPAKTSTLFSSWTSSCDLGPFSGLL